MASPMDYLPPPLSAESVHTLLRHLGLPAPSQIQPLAVTAEYHSIYIIDYDAGTVTDLAARPHPDGVVRLVLRVSGRHLPRIKTLNEVGMMTWIRRNTTIPVPSVIRFDSTEDNPIQHEFTLLECIPGTSVEKIYDRLDDHQKRRLVEQLTDYLRQLHGQPWSDGYVGGLIVSNGAIERGPVVEETFWHLPDIQKYWADQDETLESLNPIRSFSSYADYSVGSLEKYVYAIERHPSLEAYRDMIPRIRALIQAIYQPGNLAQINSVKYFLAHKDLHFANIMVDPDDPTVTIKSILDWEFSCVVPAPRWNPPRAFLWSGRRDQAARDDHDRMEALYETICKEKNAEHLLEEVQLNETQEAMQAVVNHMRAIVEVCPRGQSQDRVQKWRGIAEASMEVFGV